MALITLFTISPSKINAKRTHPYHYRYNRICKTHRTNKRSYARYHRGRRHYAHFSQKQVFLSNSTNNTYTRRKYVHNVSANYEKKQLNSPTKIHHFLNDVTSWDFYYINLERKRHHLSPVRLDRLNEKIATQRAKQTYNNYWVRRKWDDNHVHGNDGDNYYLQVRRRFTKSEPDVERENCSGWILGNGVYANGDYPAYYYKDTDAKNIAYHSVYNDMHYDQGSQWGHRDNILSSDTKRIGIGAAYSKSTNCGSLVEDYVS